MSCDDNKDDVFLNDFDFVTDKNIEYNNLNDDNLFDNSIFKNDIDVDSIDYNLDKRINKL